MLQQMDFCVKYFPRVAIETCQHLSAAASPCRPVCCCARCPSRLQPSQRLIKEPGGPGGPGMGGQGGFWGRGRGRGRGRGPGRGRGALGGKAEDKEWIPVTKLGRLVKDMKIKSLEEISLFSLPIKESEIIDFFLGASLKDEVLKIMPV